MIGLRFPFRPRGEGFQRIDVLHAVRAMRQMGCDVPLVLRLNRLLYIGLGQIVALRACDSPSHERRIRRQQPPECSAECEHQPEGRGRGDQPPPSFATPPRSGAALQRSRGDRLPSVGRWQGCRHGLKLFIVAAGRSAAAQLYFPSNFGSMSVSGLTQSRRNRSHPGDSAAGRVDASPGRGTGVPGSSGTGSPSDLAIRSGARITTRWRPI